MTHDGLCDGCAKGFEPRPAELRKSIRIHYNVYIIRDPLL